MPAGDCEGKSITATVTDQPLPTQRATPFVLLALLILGLVSFAVGGRILAKMPR